jgi:TolB-like protein
VIEQFGHSQRAAMASDLSYELIKVKWLVDQVSAAMVWAEQLRKDLQDIADYQCSM